MDVGTQIRQAREAKGWSQAKLAAGADMGVSGISQIETGARNPSVTTLSKIAEALGVGVADLFPKGQAPLPDFEDERRPSLQSWSGFVGRLADRWEAEINEREDEWATAAPPIRRNVKLVPNLQWANEIRATALDVMASANEELELALGVATSDEALQLFSTLRRLDQVIGRTDAWYSSATDAEPAKVTNIGEYLERAQRSVSARAS